MNAPLRTTVLPLVIGAFVAACSGGSTPVDIGGGNGSGGAAPASAPAAKDPRIEEWHKVIAHTPPPKDGCFRTSYPSTTWIEVPCDPPPASPVSTQPPRAKTEATRSGAQSPPGQGGGGGDWFLNESGPITQATGSFPSVQGATTATSSNTGSSPNSYSIQLNSNTFTLASTSDANLAAACPVGSCQVWQQVLYSTVGQAGTGLYFQYWVLGGGNCLALGLKGWNVRNINQCFLNSGSVPGVPLVPITDLQTISVNVVAGSSDVLTMTIEGTAYASSFPSELGLNQGSWKQVEYGVFGDLSGSSDTLSPGTTILTQIAAEPITNTASCTRSGSGNTAETNNLQDPAISTYGTPQCCLASNGAGSNISFQETNSTIEACTLCGNENQACCTPGPNGWCVGVLDVCYQGTCKACGGNGQPCCAGNSCTTPGATCQPTGVCENPVYPTCSQHYWTCTGTNGTETEAFFQCNPPPANWTLTLQRGGATVCGGTGQTCQPSVDPVTGQYSISEKGFTPTPAVGTTTYQVCLNGYGQVNCDSFPLSTYACTCTPTTCAASGTHCGTVSDGCGGTLSCGTCAVGTCSAGQCVTGSGGGGHCKPGTCG